MLTCDRQTYQDLSFDKVQSLLEEFCIGPTAKKLALQLKPVGKRDELLKFLNQTNELTQIKRIGLPFPQLEFEELEKEIRLLSIKNASLPEASFSKIRLASGMSNDILHFLEKHANNYPQLKELFTNVKITKEIIQLIDEVFDLHNQIRDKASPTLFEIRQNLTHVHKQINTSFDRCVRKYLKKGVLNEIKESFIDERRVLAVISSYKKEVNGRILGNSKTGNITFIEPGEVLPHNKELEQLKDDEQKEIFIILQQLTKKLSNHLPLIKEYQHVLTKLDFIHAKSRLALLMKANLPAILKEQRMDLIDAYHPLLRLNNDLIKKETIPQHIAMHKGARMLVISGPNAGGKSITLKTVGILQLMLQCGLLVSVHPNSKMCLFDILLTDIGDNQSIADELSTYSYRLKRMKHFLNVSNNKTLLLMDEFGTGSDPELGGALAEVFFETLYHKGCFSVITTHYNNIKFKADELPEATNGSMLFNTENLQPLFKLSIGQPGSSFTFEVAQINGISKDLIAKAKTKLDKKKVKFDQLLHELQKEKSYLTRLTQEHITSQFKAEERREFYEQSRDKYEEKLAQLRKNAEEANKFVNLGKKMQQFIDAYTARSRKKDVNQALLEEVKKFIAVEKAKIESVKNEIRLKNKEKRSNKAPTKQEESYAQDRIKVGSKVKLISTKQVGEVEEIKGKDVVISFGFARMKVKLQQLSWVKD
ncbi:MAG: DNA mismatch repair protein MutS [Brumimicrobium sp.]|nr:DNA mismatch repair protein MutS [Brumimicrobium sp.]